MDIEKSDDTIYDTFIKQYEFSSNRVYPAHWEKRNGDIFILRYLRISKSDWLQQILPSHDANNKNKNNL